jgi:H+-transporting ATPase
VYGVFMTPLGWGWALFVWGYALAWFLVNDRVKLLAYRIFDPITAVAQPEAKAAPQPEASDRLRIGAIEDRQGARH